MRALCAVASLMFECRNHLLDWLKEVVQLLHVK